MDIVSKKLSQVLNIDDEEENEDSQEGATQVNPLTNQPTYSSSLVTEADIAAYNNVQETIGLEDFSKIILMKTAQKAMQDHDELIDIMAKVDDSKAARMAEVAQAALSNSMDSAKALMNYSVAKEKMNLEKQKLEVKSVTINNIGDGGAGGMIGGTQKDIMDQIKNMMSAAEDEEEEPPIIAN